MYTKQQFGRDLLKQLEQTSNTLVISRWAYRIYLDRVRELEPELKAIVMELVAMEEGPQFEYTIEELYGLAKKLSS